MSLPLHWVESLAGTRSGDRVEVGGDEAHHAVAVRRLRVGERVSLTDGLGTLVIASVAETGKHRLVVTAEEVETRAAP
ncbi:MAG TPA: RNA methyltransferase PUA domain-containing protein, partial [Nocardioides sp.]|nr:RNA methyltransferase PUA domain-containing protein [Nocardioides sp.]